MCIRDSNSSDKPIYEQIAMQIKSLIMNGTLSAGEALPSMRTLAKDCLLYTSLSIDHTAYISLIIHNLPYHITRPLQSS